jgi:hypothetical protein
MLKTDGTIWYCGLNQDGIWGANTGSVGRRSSPVQMGAVTTWDDLSLASFSAAAAIRTDGTLWTWGKNDDHGNLGIGNRVNRSAPTQVSGTWSKVIMGRTAMGIKSDGTLWTWGTNEFGALGINLSRFKLAL